jgi:hypothetical protein
MNGTCTSFTVKVGVDDEITSSTASVIFRIYADGTLLMSSTAMGATTATQTLTVNVTGRTTLQLVVDPNGTPDYDHGDWADAQLTCS